MSKKYEILTFKEKKYLISLNFMSSISKFGIIYMGNILNLVENQNIFHSLSVKTSDLTVSTINNILGD